VTLSILQHRLYDVEVVVRRSVVFVGLTALVVVGYVLVVQAAANLLDHAPGTLDSVLAAGVVALAFAPARAALQRVVGGWVYGDRVEPVRAISDLQRLLGAAAEPTGAVRLAADRLRDALRAPWLAVHDTTGPVVEVGTRPEWAEPLLDATVLVHLGVQQGVLLVAPRSPQEPFDQRDRAMLEPLAGMVAAVLASRRLVADLQRSREEAVLGREEERRRVRRDLHDGVGPLLTALSTHADVAALRLERSPETVPELLDRIGRIAADAVGGLRRVVEDLRPSGVDELGLLGAVHELGLALAPEGVRVVVEGTPDSALPAAVEVAAYRIVAEAMHNSVRHGRADAVRIAFGAEAGDLVIEVADDGAGIGGSAAPGVGIASMHHRAEELGGALVLESSSSGTTVRARIPVRSGGAG
jgi:signal transduction histidine kinase